MGAMKDDSLYVVNGFYAAMRAKYVAPGASVYYYSVQWDSSSMSWADFRGSLLGATDPEAAAASSIRSQIALRWQSLGLESKPNVGDNGVHASASPFEGLCERLNWLGASLEDDLTGKALLDAGIKKATLLGWTKDPQVELDGSWGSLFDAFEDLSLPAVLKTAQKLGGDPFEECPNCTTNQAFVFIKPHANTLAVRSLVKSAMREAGIAVLDEGEIDAVTILSRKLIDNHYYAIANKASLSKPVELNPPAAKLAEFTAKFGSTWSQVDALKEVAIDDFKSEKYEQAIKHLTVALSLDEKSHVLFSNRCTAHIALEQYEKAMQDADECVRLQPSWAKGYLRRGSVYFRMGQLEKAEVVLKEGLELDPGNDALKKELEAVMNAIAERMARQRESLEAKERAIEAFNDQNYKAAVELLKKAIKLDPDNHIFYSNRAAAHMALEQYERAMQDADECIRLQPSWAKGYSRRGAALFRMDKLGPARDAFEKGMELDPDNATYVRCTRQELQLVMDAIAQRKEESLEFKERAIEAFNVQNFKRAEQHLSSAIDLDPENHVFYSNRAAAYMAMEKYEKALHDANECVRLQPTWAKGYSRQAAAFLSLSQLPAAREACIKGLDLEPENSQVREELRRVEIAEALGLKDAATEAFKAQDYERAVEDLTGAIALDSSNQVFFSNRSVAFTAMQMYEKALDDADECIRLNPSWAKGYSRRAAAKFHLGDLQAAKLAYSKAWDLEPANQKTKADLEHVLSEIAGMKVVLPDRAA